ncbi:Set domain-containing hypothetical protein [Phytophthora megakarya]|uniref:SET domain-containing protein n=1 Tax=Phytophthora megakarya TaxID=4795 RepID=A0A225WG43_9STRA|nr:Set domain-containing hypothetical protein [Phytophthora megakarya]
MPGIKFRLFELRERRPNFVVSRPPTIVPYLGVEWPARIEQIVSGNAHCIALRDIRDFGSCSCSENCFLHTCNNAVSAVCCTEDNFNLQGLCSKSPRARSTLRLFASARVGLGVFTTTDLDVGDIVAEYTGDLSEFDAIFEGQLDAALKENSSYTLLLNTKSTRRKYVDVDAVKRGSIARYISHSCNPNVVFVEVQYRKTVKVLVRMLEDVKGGHRLR